MPELPEVEYAARCLRRWAAGRRIEAVELDPRGKRILRPSTPKAFAAALAGARFADIRRIGKHLLVSLEQGGAPVGLLAHLGMTGKWLRSADGEPAPRHARARFRLDDGATLEFNDPRLFGRLRVVPGARFEAIPEIAALGPDPLADGIDPARLHAGLARTRLAVKPKLLDQRLLAGVGNIHASEACFRARIDPRRRSSTLSPAEAKRLGKAILDSFHMTLQAEDGPEIVYVEEGGENPFLVYAREGERCPRCKAKGTIERIVQAQRSTFFCRRCQG